MRTLVLLLLAMAGGCAGAPSMLDPRGPAAEAIAGTWWVMFWGSLLIFTLVMGCAWFAVYHRGRSAAPPGEWLIAVGGVGFPAVALTGLLIYGFKTEWPGGTETPDHALQIEVVGHRWWWEVRYPDATDGVAVTANEIHIPAGRPVRLRLSSADVIHSFWVPQLAGKMDMIPGHTNELWLQADAPGAYRGQCAEFCGAQHTHMAFWVIAEAPERFQRWLARQGRPAAAPESEAARRGRAHFLSRRCVECHTIRGTPARGEVGPDLTHVGDRRTLAAGTLANGHAAIARWIAHNQRIKPGNRMLSFEQLEQQVIDDIATYLVGLE